jgi:Dynamin family
VTADAFGPTLRSQVDQALDGVARRLASPGPRGAREALADALRGIEENRTRWNGRMRVALAGRVSSGKSTLVNALLGEKRVETAVEALTAVVTWLQYAPETELAVFYRNGDVRRVDPPTLDALADLTTHQSGSGADFADEVDYVGYRYRNDELDRFDLIDTPGTGSKHEADSTNTFRHLSPREDTADALVLVFAKGVNEEDTRLLDLFMRTGKIGRAEISPLTTIGALTQVERNWKDDEDLLVGGRLRVLVEGKENAAKWMGDAGMRRLLYELRPIASKIAEAAGTFTVGEDFRDLVKVATSEKIGPRDVAERVGNARKWSRGEIDGVSVPADRRESLLKQFTGCGIVLACHLIREGVDDPAELRNQLRLHSGLTEFRRTLTDHFGERGDLIKLDRLIERTRDLCDDQRITLTAVQADILDEATTLITGLRSAQPAFNERAALRAHYERKLAFDEEQTEEMLRLFGESPGGRSIADLLGLPGASPGQLAKHAQARSVYWRGQIDLGAAGETREACRTLSSSYNHLRLLLAGG